MNNLPLSLYIHIPWCVEKCPYCDFNSHKQPATLPEVTYLDTLTAEIDERLLDLVDRPIQTIFIGGGTPSLFSPDAYARLFDVLRTRTTFADEVEITLEANPGTVDENHFAGYRSVGINRLSLGIQSFQDAHLKRLGRIHDSQTALHAIDVATSAGFDRINLDLMFGLSQQTVNEGLTDLQLAIAQDTTHLSWYQLTIEPHTHFHAFPPPLPEDDAIWTLQTEGVQLLCDAGFHQYEVSAYEKHNNACRHNLNYWQFGDYVGIGAGAHSKLTNKSGAITRYWNTKHPKQYMDPSVPFVAGQKILTHDDAFVECCLNAFRLKQPASYHVFETRAGWHKSACQERLASLRDAGWLHLNDDAIALTDKGEQYLNELLMLLL